MAYVLELAAVVLDFIARQQVTQSGDGVGLQIEDSGPSSKIHAGSTFASSPS